MPSTLTPSIPLPAGYEITDRLGSGGYGEVWRATAPGGVEKAIKIVFGHCGEELADRELKSLERIRSVRHPFVLSLERFEVVEGRLVIVTELADMSLDECFRRHREAGRPGIPRDELLSYLSDAAEALDCLVHRHGLQHLDIKPENLLLVGDHVKVADFGLVKELNARTLNSMMGGMTPLYSAPEIYDDKPSSHSDQYSLAIVYQQMLTGTLPFPGRTPAQLAKQHTQAQPNLQPLSEADRRVVARALEKQPEKRFDRCAEFIEALRTGKQSRSAPDTPPAEIDTSTRAISAAEDDTQSVTALRSRAAAHGPDVTRALAGGEPLTPDATPPRPPLEYPQVRPEIIDVAVPSVVSAASHTIAPTLFLAAGGVGIRMMMCARQAIGRERLAQPPMAWLAIDTDRETLQEATFVEGDAALESACTLHTPLRRPKQYRDASQDLLRWVSRRWLYNIPRSLQTRGYRPLGRIAIVDHAETIMRHLQFRLQHLAEQVPNRSTPAPRRVVLLAGMSGGTGGGVLVDLAQACRSIAAGLGVQIHVQGVLGATLRGTAAGDSLAAANMYSLLTELADAQHRGNRGSSTPPGAAARYESSHPAFDDVYAIPIPSRTQGELRAVALESIGNYLALDATTPACGLLAACRRADEPSQGFALRTFSCVAAGQLSAAETLARSETVLLDCGYRRRTLVVTPNDCPAEDLIACVQRARPAAAAVQAAITRPYLLCEGSGLRPLDLAARLAATYPDIDEAAARLHARSDIEWRDLRAS